MADKVITAASVLKSSSGTIRQGTAGEALTQGQALYFDAGTQTYKLFDANGAGDIHSFAGIALNAAAAGQPVTICTEDPDFAPGCAVSEGEVLIGSATAGGICPVTEAASGHYVTIIGVGKGNNKINFKPVSAGVANA